MHNSFDELIKAHQGCCSKSKVASENGKRIEIVSDESFTKIRIDDHLIPSKRVQKCDFGFVRHFNNEFYFVELKGKDVKTAVEQIISTIAIFESTLINNSKRKKIRIYY
ncbi:MAG: hypothetical protein ABI892_03595 [Flavobacterium sp.]